MVGAVIAVLASYSIVGPVTVAHAASLTGSSFEIDTNANLVRNGSLDWLAGGSGSSRTAGVMVKTDLLSGSGDDSFKGGTHEDSAVPEVEDGSIPPSKSDLKTFGVYVERTGSAVFLNVFWTRVQDPSGTTNMDFEFNQSAVKSNDPPGSPQVVPVRTAGDLLMTYDLTNGGTVATVSRRIWGGSSWGSSLALSASQAIGSVNSSSILATDSGGLGALDPRTFGEASVNLAALIPVEQGCVTYGSAYLKSRSSASFNSELKDLILPEPVTISNCGAVKIHKTDDNGALAGAVFTLYKDVAPIGGTKGTGDTVVAGACTTNSVGDCTISDVRKGDYWLVETGVPAGHDGVAPQHVTITEGDQVVELRLNNPIQMGTITVTKNAIPDDAKDFSFTLDGDGFSLDDDGVVGDLPATRSFTVPVGNHSVTELVPDGWTLTGLVCTDPSGGTTIATPTASISLAKDETVHCTFTNEFTKLGVDLRTQTSAANGGGWNDSAQLTGDGTHPVTGTVRFFACAASPTATACATGGTEVGTAAIVTPVSGAEYAAVTTAAYAPSAAGYSCFRAEYTSTSAFYNSSSHTNATTECFLKQAQNLTIRKTATAAFGRVYTWDVQKSVDDSTVNIPAGDTAHSAYAVTVSNSFSDEVWTVTGTITVTNPNPVPFSGVNVTDSINNGAGTCAVTGGTSAAVPASGQLALAYSCTYTSAPSPSAGTNTATATWNAGTYFTPAGTATATATVDFSEVTPSVSDEIVNVTDSVQGFLGTLDARTAANPTVFRYVVDRSGNAGTCTPYDNTATVTTNDSQTTGAASAQVTVCVGVNLTAGVTASGTRDRDNLWSIAKRVDQTRVEIAQGGTATFTYQVEVTPAGSVDSNFGLSGLVGVTNPNDWQAITAAVTVTSNVGGGVSCTVTGGSSVPVPASGTVSRPYSCTFTGAPAGSGSVTATVTWNAGTAFTPGSSATATAGVSFAVAGETHATVTVVDDKTDPANPVTLGTRAHADGPHTFTYSITKAGVAGQCTSYTNTAILTETSQSASRTVTVCVGVDLTLRKTALASDHQTFLWSIDKNVDKTTQSVAAGGTTTFGYEVTVTPSGRTESGWSVTGQISVTNPNAWQDITADITDAVSSGGGATCLVGNGVDVVIGALQTVTLDYACSFSSAPSDGTNTATATWDAESAATPQGSATGTASVVFVPRSQTNETITVVDDKTDPANPVTLGTATYGNGPKTFAYTLVKQGVVGTCTDYTNIAVISQTGQSDSQVVQVCVGEALTLAASAAGSFDRDHLWLIDKAVDRTTVTIPTGTSATFAYTVTVTPNGVADSGYDLDGTVTLTNPNDWQDVVADVTVTTDLGGGAVCTVLAGEDRIVPEDGSLVLTYGCVFTGVPATTGTVSVDASWDQVASSTPIGTASAGAPAALLLDAETHATVTVVDDKTNPASPVTLGTADWADAATEFTYTLAKPAVGAACTTFTNVAQLVETEQSDSQDVEVCGFTGGGGVVTPPTGGGGGLAVTGDMTGLLTRWALALLAAGAFLLVLGRRRTA